MDDYGSKKDEMESIIDEYKKNHVSDTLPHGKFLMKRMYSATPNDVDNVVRAEEKAHGIKIHVVVIDYFTEMGNDLGIRQDNAFNTYMYHKTNSQALFNNAGIGKYTVISAHQSSEIDPNSETIDLTNLSESKGILHRPDSVIGIIQSASMKQDRRYKLKGLKTRHSKYKDYVVDMRIDYQYMRLKCYGLEPETQLIG